MTKPIRKHLKGWDIYGECPYYQSGPDGATPERPAGLLGSVGLGGLGIGSDPERAGF